MSEKNAVNSGLAPNLAGALAYVLAPLTGIIFLLVEKQDGYVRFHAAQSILFGVGSIILWVANSILGVILSAIPLLGWIVSLLITMVLGLGLFVLWIYLMVQAYQGREWELPVVGGQSRRLVASAQPDA